MPSIVKYVSGKKPATVFCLFDKQELVGVYERKIDAQNDIILFNLSNPKIVEEPFK